MSVSSITSSTVTASLTDLSALLSKDAASSAAASNAASTTSATQPTLGGLVSEILSALASTVSPQAISSEATSSSTEASGTGSSGTHSTSSKSDVSEALKEFLHDLMTALKADAPGAQSSSTSTPGGDSTASAAESRLQTSFDTLMTDLGGTTGAASLNSFLQSFASSVESASPLGNLVNSTV